MRSPAAVVKLSITITAVLWALGCFCAEHVFAQSATYSGQLGGPDLAMTMDYTVDGVVVDVATEHPGSWAKHTFGAKVCSRTVTIKGRVEIDIAANYGTTAGASATIYGEGVTTAYWQWVGPNGSGNIGGDAQSHHYEDSFELTAAVPDTCQYLVIEARISKTGGITIGDSLYVDCRGRTDAPLTPPATPVTKKIPLCPRALEYFTPAELAQAQFKDCLRLGHDDLSKQFNDVLDAYNAKALKEGLPQAYASFTANSALPMLLWLFTTDTMSIPDPSSLTDLDAIKAQPFKKFHCTFTNMHLVDFQKIDAVIPEVSEWNLVNQIIAESERRTTAGQDGRLMPGEVFGMALNMTKGNTPDALLLAHNTLRSATRGIGSGLTCVPMNHGCGKGEQFEKRYLATIREGDNGGPWYHLFGTAYFEMAVHNDAAAWAFNTNLEDLSQVADKIANQLGLLVTGSPGSPAISEDQYITALSAAVNQAEQLWRQRKDSRLPDPEKFCVNLWGQVIAQDLQQRMAGEPDKFPKYPLVPLVPDYGGRFIDLSGMHMGIVHCPVAVTLSGDGGTLRFDPATQSFSGTAPAYVLPFIEADNELGLCWFEVPGHPVEVTMDAVRDGQLVVGDVVFGSSVGGRSIAVLAGQSLTQVELLGGGTRRTLAPMPDGSAASGETAGPPAGLPPMDPLPQTPPPASQPAEGGQLREYVFSNAVVSLPSGWSLQPGGDANIHIYFGAERELMFVIMLDELTHAELCESAGITEEWHQGGEIGGRAAWVTQAVMIDGESRGWIVSFTDPLDNGLRLHVFTMAGADQWDQQQAYAESLVARIRFN